MARNIVLERDEGRMDCERVTYNQILLEVGKIKWYESKILALIGILAHDAEDQCISRGFKFDGTVTKITESFTRGFNTRRRHKELIITPTLILHLIQYQRWTTIRCVME